MAESRERMARPVALSTLLASVFKGKPAEKRLREGIIWQVWDAAVGKQIAAQARPINIRDGVLTVAVSSAPWMQQLTFLKKDIIRKLNTVLKEELVRDIYLKAGSVEAAPTAPARREKKKRSLTPAEEQQVAAQTASVEDVELRAALARLIARHLAEQDATPPRR